MLIPRKMNLSPAQHEVCDQVRRLRESMGLAKGDFARQVGCTRRTLQRWENHTWIPTKRYLRRLAQLHEMNSRLEAGERPAFLERHPERLRRYSAKEAREMATRFLALILRQLVGGAVTFTKEQFERTCSRIVPQVRFDPEREQFRVWVRPVKKQKKGV